MQVRSLLFLMVAAALVSGCQRGKVFERHSKMDRLAWNRFNLVNFEVPIKDASAGYDFYVAIRHITEIPYSSLEISFAVDGPDGSETIRDIKIPIRDREGKLLGNGMGDLWDVEVLAKEGLRFSETGTCKVEVASRMQQADLLGIMEVGLVVKKSKR